MAVETITTTLVAAANYDLTSIATLKDDLSIPLNEKDDDKFLARAISQCSAVIANYCKRTFPVEYIQDLLYIQQDPYPFQVPGGVFALQLSRWPLVNTAVVSFTGNTDGATTTISGIASTAGLAVGLPVFGGGFAAGSFIATVGSGTITVTQPAGSALPPAATGVAFSTGLQVVQTISGAGATPTTLTLLYGRDFTIDAKKGWLIRLDPFTGVATKWEAMPVTVQYSAGYSPIPDDLEDAALRMVVARYKARGRDPFVRSESDTGLGQKAYWVGVVPGSVGSIPPEVAGLLDAVYRVPTVA